VKLAKSVCSEISGGGFESVFGLGGSESSWNRFLNRHWMTHGAIIFKDAEGIYTSWPLQDDFHQVVDPSSPEFADQRRIRAAADPPSADDLQPARS